MRITNNITAVNSHRQYGINTGNTSKNMEKLSSGYRVNRAGDDASGLAISEKMRAQIRGLSQAGRNVQDGVSLLQVADGAMQLASDILQRMRELAAQSANGTNMDEIDREALNLEYQQLILELDQIADTTNFNGVYPLKGSSVVNPRNTSFQTTGISSAQIPALDLSVVENPGGDDPAAFISGSSINIPNSPTPVQYRIDSTALAGVDNFTLGNNVTLIVDGDVDGPVNFHGNGSVKINGSITGTGTTLIDSTTTVQVTVDIPGTVINSGELTIGPSGTPNFSGSVVNSGKMVLAKVSLATSSIVNSGDLRIAANGSRVTSNSGNIRYQPGAPATTTQITTGWLTSNSGRVEISANSNVNNFGTNAANGKILVEGGGTLGGSGNVNNGLVEIAGGSPSGFVTFSTNNSNGIINSMGTIQIGIENFGFIQIGRWENDTDTPYQGSAGSIGMIATNSGTIRNFSETTRVVDNDGGTIDNYGTIISPLPSPAGDIRHHARQIDTTGISNNPSEPQTIGYFVNGVYMTDTVNWEQVAGGYELAFDAPSSVDGGQVVFSSWQSFRVDGMQYGIKDPVPARTGIPSGFLSSGTTGISLLYSMDEPLPIQSGANEGDAIFLSFRALNAWNLGTEAESPLIPKLAAEWPDYSFENIEGSHILSQDAAAVALTITLKAINDVSLYRAELGAQYNRLEFTYDNIGTTNENQAAAESRIRDADMAKEMTVFTKNNILQQSSTAMLAQANALPQGVLSLLG